MKLIDHVLDIRRLIQQSFDNRFSRLGLKVDTPSHADSLSKEDLKRRAKLENIMQSHLDELQGDYAAARQATINECVFTLFNRIAAIKVMESKELFPEIITRRKENAGRSFEHNAWLEDHPEERNAEREGLKHFLTDQFNQIGENIPLFKADYPYSLMPTADELNEIIDLFNAIEADPDCGENVWKGDDILGWLYENFNAVEKEVFDDSGEKTEYDKVSLQSQVYTPQWVVKFLVDNSLGKSYLEMFPDSQIKDKYMIANASVKQVKTPKDIRTMKLLDPACGSGNFLIYAFTLFYDLYIDQMENYEKDYSRRDIPKMIIENNLYGVDLDERAAQISQIALFIKAREVGGHRSHWPKYTNIVSSHFFLPSYDTVRAEFGYDTSWNKKFDIVARKIWTDLSEAYKFGSLIRVEEQINTLASKDEENTLYGTDGSLFDGRVQLKTQLSNLVNKYGEQNDNAYSLLKMNEAISFLDIISNTYDVVVANPPYTDSGDFGHELKTFVEDNYRCPLKFNSNLYACFIKRCCELVTSDGKVGMIHPLTFMYIKKFEDARKYILNNFHIDILAELGLGGVFPNVQVDVAMYILGDSTNKADGIYINLTKYKNHTNKPQIFKNAYQNLIIGEEDTHIYWLPQNKIKKIKSYPFIYWISDEFRKKFNGKVLEDVVGTKKGLDTSCNERFLRFWWEIDSNDISIDYELDKKKWVTYAKGGPYNKWYGNMWLTINWGNDGYDLKHHLDESGHMIPTLRNQDVYFKEGLTYSAAGSKGTTFRYLPKNCIIDSGGPGIYSFSDANIYYVLALLNSKLTNYVCECLNPTVNTTHGDLRRIPFANASSSQEQLLVLLSKQNIAIKQSICCYSIIEPRYKYSPLFLEPDIELSIYSYYRYENALLTQILLNECIINHVIFDVYELSNRDRQMVLDKEGIIIGDIPICHEAKIAYRKWLTEESEIKPSKELLEHLDGLEEHEGLPLINDLDSLYLTNNGWEEFCFKKKMNPVDVWYQFCISKKLPPQRTQILAFQQITDLIRTVLFKDDDGVVPLGDKYGEERLSLRIEREFLEQGHTTLQFNQICQLLGMPLEDYLQERFFTQLCYELDVFKYLPATPFIWHLSSGPHHAMELYISIYRWNRDTLFRIRSVYAANREAALRDQLHSLDTSSTEGRMEAKELQDMLNELQSYCVKIDDLLASGYNPTLDDGVGKNIAPLQKRGMISYEVLKEKQLEKYLNADW